MRDVLLLPFSDDEAIVIASDNSGAIGQKDGDAVKVPYETVSYYSFRVAVMECMAAGGKPFAITLQNFCGEDAWLALTAGIEQGLAELEMPGVKMTGSTESNFALSQSAIGLTVLGKKKNSLDRDQLVYADQLKISVIGSPLVGAEVVEKEAEIVPLALFNQISSLKDVVTLPVGSKGILYEMNQIFSNKEFSETLIETNLDIHKSSGPSTCFIAVYPAGRSGEVESAAGEYFHKINILKRK